jgi:hypothetical protein
MKKTTSVYLTDDWAYVGPRHSRSHLAIYPRQDGTWSIGKPDTGRTYRDVETGFANPQAALAHAVWLFEEGE